MTARLLAVFGALLALAALPRPSAAQRASIIGRVLRDSSDVPIEGAEVTLPQLDRRAASGRDGKFQFVGLRAGRYAIVIRRVGFAPALDTIGVAENQQLEVDISLVASPVALDSVRTVAASSATKYHSPGLIGFEERRSRGFGHFISEEQLRKNDERSFIDVLQSFLPGVIPYEPDPRINPTAKYLKSSRKCASGPIILSCRGPNSACPVSLYVDGVLMVSSTAANLLNLAALQTKEFAGVEFYADGATLPPRYNSTGNDCGTLMLWTRER